MQNTPPNNLHLQLLLNNLGVIKQLSENTINYIQDSMNLPSNSNTAQLQIKTEQPPPPPKKRGRPKKVPKKGRPPKEPKKVDHSQLIFDQKGNLKPSSVTTKSSSKRSPGTDEDPPEMQGKVRLEKKRKLNQSENIISGDFISLCENSNSRNGFNSNANTRGTEGNYSSNKTILILYLGEPLDLEVKEEAEEIEDEQKAQETKAMLSSKDYYDFSQSVSNEEQYRALESRPYLEDEEEGNYSGGEDIIEEEEEEEEESEEMAEGEEHDLEDSRPPLFPDSEIYNYLNENYTCMSVTSNAFLNGKEELKEYALQCKRSQMVQALEFISRRQTSYIRVWVLASKKEDEAAFLVKQTHNSKRQFYQKNFGVTSVRFWGLKPHKYTPSYVSEFVRKFEDVKIYSFFKHGKSKHNFLKDLKALENSSKSFCLRKGVLIMSSERGWNQ